MYIYILIKTEYTVIFNFKNVSTTVFLNYTTLPLPEKSPNTELLLSVRTRNNSVFGLFSRSVHVYNSYLQVELFIVTIFYYYIKELLITE